jgi:hypothetical protein
MTYIVDILTPYQEESFLRWAKEAAVEVKSKATPRKRKPIKATLDLEKFDEETRQGIAETLEAYRSDNKAYFAQSWEPEYLELKKELQEAGVTLCRE